MANTNGARAAVSTRTTSPSGAAATDLSDRSDRPTPRFAQHAVDDIPPMADRHVPLVCWTAIGVIVGYLALGRGFAQLGVAGAGLFIGELIVVALLVYRPSRRALLEFVGDLLRPGPAHLLAWATLLFVATGAVSVVVGWRAEHPIVEIANTFAYTYYVLFVPIGMWLGRAVPDLLHRLIRVLAWANLVYGLLFVAFLDDRGVFLPASSAPLGGPQGSGVAIIGLLSFEEKPERSWHLLVGNFIVMLLQQKRAEWIGFGMAVVVWTLWGKRYALLAGATAVLVAAIVVSSILGLEIGGAENRGGTVSATGVAARLVAPLDEELALRFASEEEVRSFAGTAQWRQEWWDGIWAQIHADETRTLLGNGHGFDISDLSPNDDTEASRTPHNIFFYVLGYGGWLGIAGYGTFIAALIGMMVVTTRRTGNPFGLAFFAVCLGIGLFSNFFETPFGAIPFYAISGMAIAPALNRRERPGADRSAAGRAGPAAGR